MFEPEALVRSPQGPTTIDALVDLVKASGLLAEAELQTYLDRLRSAAALPTTPAELAAAMVRDGLLTGFQAQHFLAGKAQGLLIHDKYKLLDHLGTGGMGSVYLCEHKTMRRRVAIKVLPASQAESPDVLERFHREARAVATLDHPNIVRAHDIDHDGKLHFLVMEYVDGSNLNDLVKQHGPLNVDRACHYLRQAALGLQAAHEAGLVHRDIKPGNLLVDRQGVIKILDMGLARFFHDTTDNITTRYDEHSVLGTADYCAPEQAVSSHTADIRADIYSLGATFFYLLTGGPPCGEGTVAQKILWHQLRPLPPLRDLHPEVPEGVAAILHRMMAKDPQKRYPTPIEVYDALEPWAQGDIPPPSEEELPRLDPATRRAPLSSVRSRAPGLTSKRLPAGPAPAEAEVLSLDFEEQRPRSRLLPIAAGVGAIALVVVLLTIFGWRAANRQPVPVTATRPVAGDAETSPPEDVTETAPDNPDIAASPVEPAQDTATASTEGVAISLANDLRRIQTPNYAAVLDSHGAMLSLRAGGVEILKPPAKITRGAGAYLRGIGFLDLPVDPSAHPNDAALAVSSDPPAVQYGDERASVRYEFGTDTITCHVVNRTQDEMKYYVVIGSSVTIVLNEQGEIMQIPLAKSAAATDRQWPTAIWPVGDAKLTLSGGTKIWGPWHEGGQATIYEATLPGLQTRHVVFKFSPSEAED